LLPGGEVANPQAVGHPTRFRSGFSNNRKRVHDHVNVHVIVDVAGFFSPGEASLAKPRR
jgi:hypothetical protein